MSTTTQTILVMPPRADRRRGGRTNRDEAGDTAPALMKLKKPQLPKLQGTPSSRRQYTYGAGEEPLPSRPGQKLGGHEELDLGNAIGSLLQRQEEEDQARMAPPPPPPAVNVEQDELSQSRGPTARTRSSSRYLFSTPSLTLY
jgi:hypothetical protein